MSLDKRLAGRLLADHPGQAAAVLERLSDEAVVGVVIEATAPVAAVALSHLAPLRAASLLSQVGGRFARELMPLMGLDVLADLTRRMDPDARDRFLGGLDPGAARLLEGLIQFPEGTAGSLMDSRVLALPLDVTAGEAIEQIRKAPDSIRYNLYVVDRERRLVGVLNLRELLLADHEQTLGSVAKRDVMSIEGHRDRAAVLAHPAWRAAHSLPVIDRAGVYLGALRYRTWRRLEDEATRHRERNDSHTADALGDLFSAGVEGLLGALTNLASPTTRRDSNGGE